MIHDHPPKAPRRALSKRLLGTYLTLQLCKELVVLKNCLEVNTAYVRVQNIVCTIFYADESVLFLYNFN